ncbi:hypothetical protein GCM10023214_59070 [Amycolatopsis dongchuanensis]
MQDSRAVPENAHPIGLAPHRGHSRPAALPHHNNDHEEHPMSHIHRHGPRPMVTTVVGSIASGIVRALFDWLLQHFTH